MLSACRSGFSLSTEVGLIRCTLNSSQSEIQSEHCLYSFSTLSCSDILVFCSSATGKYLALADTTKKLTLFNFENGSCVEIGNRCLPRCTACMTFTPDERFIIIGEKSGNVYKVSVMDMSCPGDSQNVALLLGHSSILSDIAVSSDCKLLATCDRDEKIRVSRFQQPYVIEAFCLGHTCFISQLAFLPGSYFMISAGGDGCLRLWDSPTGTELSCIQLSFSDDSEVDIIGSSEANRIVISRLFVPNCDVCIGSSSSHSFVFAARIEVNDQHSVRWGTISYKATPAQRPLIDSAVCTVDDSLPMVLVGLISEDLPRIILWSLDFSTQCSDAIQWKELQVVNPIPPSILKLPEPIPRLELLKCLQKSNPDRSRIEAYEDTKPIRHQHVSDRRLRHQQKRQARKRLKQTLVNEPSNV